MASVRQTFDCFVTNIDKIGPLLKISGQTDRNTSCFIEKVLLSVFDKFENEPRIVHLENLSVGLVCCAKYKDGSYYRAQVMNLNSVTEAVEVRFIDYGNIEFIKCENIRLIDESITNLRLIKPQSSEFVLADAVHVRDDQICDWSQQALDAVLQDISYIELKCVLVSIVNGITLVKMIYQNEDLCQYLVRKGLAAPYPCEHLEMLLGKAKEVVVLKSNVSTSHAPELCSYKSFLLEPDSEHMVYVSYVEDGPNLFAVQLQSMEESFEMLMHELNSLPLVPLTEPPVPGYPCLARCLYDSSICRGVVTNIVGDECKTYFVDFGNTDNLPFGNIYQIPFRFMLPKVLSMRFTLAGVRSLKLSVQNKCAFKEFVTNKLLRLKVLRVDGSPVLQHCELYDNNANIVDILYEMKRVLEIVPIVKGTKYLVIVSFIEGCKKFFVQLKEHSYMLGSVMRALAAANGSSRNVPSDNVKVGLICSAFYTVDQQWYRAQVISVEGESVTVKYVDYGNEETVQVEQLRQLSDEFVNALPAQAIECCLYGYQNMTFDTEIENTFESLTLECEFSMMAVSKQSNGVWLVDLFTETGNNVAALLIEKLAAMKAHVTCLPSQHVTNRIVRPHTDDTSDPKLTWRTNNQSEYIMTEDSGKSWRENCDQSKSWRSKHRSRNASSVNNRKSSRNKKGNSDRPTNDVYSKRQFGEGPVNRKAPEMLLPNRKPSLEFGSKRQPQDNNSNSKKLFENSYEERDFTNKKPSRDFMNRKIHIGETFQKKSYDSDGSNTSDRSKKKSSDRSIAGKRVSPWRDKNFEKSSQLTGKSFNNFNKGSKPRDSFHSPDHLPVSLDSPGQELAPLDQTFRHLQISLNSTKDVATCWFFSPDDFYCHSFEYMKQFKQMMLEIQSTYRGRPPYNGHLDIGSSVIAEFHEDNGLYRAVVMKKGSLGRYGLKFVDFGNTDIVDCTKIWQVEKRFMDMPMQAVKCRITGVRASSVDWVLNEAIDNIFNKKSFRCTFESYSEDRYGVQLCDGDVDVAQQLISSGLAVECNSNSVVVDEQIDVNLLSGQRINVWVSHVEGLDKFYVHLNKNKAQSVLKHIDDYVKNLDKLNLQVLSPQQINEGAVCLVNVDNNKWLRGVINKVKECEAEISYVDYGGIINLSFDKLFVLPQYLHQYWYQAFECSICNLSEYVTLLSNNTDFKENYEMSDLILYINDVVGSRLLVTPYNTDGNKLKLIDFNEEIFPNVEPICALPVFTNRQRAMVSFIESIDSVYIQYIVHAEQLALMLEGLFEFYEQGGEILEPIQDSLCVAKSESDGNWYRARVKAITDNSILVKYIDYGNCEFVSKQHVKVLDKSFYVPHAMALNTRMALKEAKDGAVNKLSELTADKELQCVMSFNDIGWISCLYDADLNINQTLIDLNFASYEINSASITECHMDMQNETRAKILITHIDSPGEFYVQLHDNKTAITNLQELLREKAQSFCNLEGVDVGVLCAAKYSIDDEWYRAEVLDADSEIITVRFVDYGNTDVIHNECGKVKTLPADLLAVDKYARKCSLNVTPVDGDEWPQEACCIFETAVSMGDIYADIVYQDERNKTYVELDIDGKNIATFLTDNNFAVSIVRDIEDKIANCTGFVSHMNSISEFWIQLESSVYDLEMICDRLATSDEFPDMSDFSPGLLCAANYPDDQKWYRARILSHTVAGVEVLFVDYGNSSTAVTIKVLPEDLVQMPILAQKCSLNRPLNIQKWSKRATDRFLELSADGATVFTIKKLTASETSIVELFIDGVNILDQLVELCDECELEKDTQTFKTNLVKGCTMQVQSPSNFYVRLDSDMEILKLIIQELELAEDYKPLDSVKQGMLCAAFSEKEHMWYRAKITSHETDYEVFLIDYSNMMNTNKVHMLPDKLNSMPPLAILCSLESPNQLCTSAQKKFLNLLENSGTQVEIEFLDTESVSSLVRLFLNGKNIWDLIEDQGKSEHVISEDTQNLHDKDAPYEKEKYDSFYDECVTDTLPVVGKLLTNEIEQQVQSDHDSDEKKEMLNETIDILKDDLGGPFQPADNVGNVQVESEICVLELPEQDEENSKLIVLKENSEIESFSEEMLKDETDKIHLFNEQEHSVVLKEKFQDIVDPCSVEENDEPKQITTPQSSASEIDEIVLSGQKNESVLENALDMKVLSIYETSAEVTIKNEHSELVEVESIEIKDKNENNSELQEINKLHQTDKNVSENSPPEKIISPISANQEK